MDQLLTVKETSKILKINVGKVYELVKSGLLPALKLGSIKIPASSIDSFIQSQIGMDLSDLTNVQPMGK